MAVVFSSSPSGRRARPVPWLCFLLLCISFPGLARAASRTTSPSPKAGWETWTLEEQGRRVVVEVARDDRRLPLVVFAAGSHCLPVFFTTPSARGARERSMLPFDVDEARKRLPFHFAVVERANLRSFGVVEDVRAVDHCTAEHGGVHKKERVSDLALAARALRAEPWASRLLLAGHSEGADVAAGAARALDPGEAAAVGFFASGGVSQFVDLVLEGRRKGDAKAAQRSFDDLLAMTGEAPPEDFQGFPRARFDSFAIASTPLDDLVGLDLPVFIVQGTADTNSAPETADALAVELLRRDAHRAVRYVVLDGGDHAFGDGAGARHGEEILTDFVAWATQNAPTRGVETRSFGKPTHAPTVRFLRIPAWTLLAIMGTLGSVLVWARRSRRARARFVLGVLAFVSFVAAGATAGLWGTIAAGAPDAVLPVVTGMLAASLAAVSSLWATATPPPSTNGDGAARTL